MTGRLSVLDCGADCARNKRKTRLAAVTLASCTLLTALLLISRNGGSYLHQWQVIASKSTGPPPPKMPWAPLLTPDEQGRGVAHYGGGARLRRVAAKLMAGQPIKVFTLGGSVTYGHGVEDAALESYPALFFQYINATFPHRDHVLLNRGLPGSTSMVTAPCVHSMVDPGSDLVVVEFSTNDSPSAWTSRGKHSFETMLRSLLALPGRPAVVLLHHYPWWKAAGDGRGAGLFYREPEGQLTTFSYYYDLPSLSLRSAAWRLMHAGIEGFKVDRTLLDGNRDAATGEAIPAAEPGAKDDYLYLDTIHPGPNGHKVLAELLVGLLSRAAGEAAADGGEAPLGQQRRDPRLEGLPPPMIPNYQEMRASFCAQLEDFKATVVRQQGFQYRPEKPLLPRFEEQKWGWSADKPGAWVELQIDTRATPPPHRPQRPAGTAASSVDMATATTSGTAPPLLMWSTSVLLGHLRSYSGMGTARVECRSGCTCRPNTLDGTSASRASVFKIHSIQVTQHRRCRLRVTISKDPGGTPQEGHKVMLAAVMVAHTARSG